MRVAVLSDIHANRHALEAVAKDARERRIDEFWCLGDVVGYGAHPRETLEWVEANARWLVKGNHDHAVASGDLLGFNESAAVAARFHAQTLDPEERARIFAWPLHVAREVEGLNVLIVHASPDDPLREYVLPTDVPRALERWRGRADLILLGHTHVPFFAQSASPDAPRAWRPQGFADTIRADLAAASRDVLVADAADDETLAEGETLGLDDTQPFVVANPGSVGQPRDLDPRASYALLDFGARTVELRRVAYDVEAAAQAIQRAGLPTLLALRLYRGR